MTEIKSNKSELNRSIQETYEYLSVPANYKDLMPSKVRSFESTEDTAILDIEGLGKVELAITERNEPNNIVMRPQNKVPFKFDMQWHLKPVGKDKTEIEAIINADLNFMMKMMAEGLLKNFVNTQVTKLTEKLNG